ncbi:MAG: hypothetical protein AAFR60_10575 [Pseudomonadota bacterium]
MINFREFGVAAAVAFALAFSATAAAASDQTAPTAASSTGGFQVAQACGLYAIGTCARRPGPARRSSNFAGGRVIWTNNIGNFRPGWFCQVAGPTSRGNANAWRRAFRRDGIRSAYIKYGC